MRNSSTFAPNFKHNMVPVDFTNFKIITIMTKKILSFVATIAILSTSVFMASCSSDRFSEPMDNSTIQNSIEVSSLDDSAIAWEEYLSSLDSLNAVYAVPTNKRFAPKDTAYSRYIEKFKAVMRADADGAVAGYTSSGGTWQGALATAAVYSALEFLGLEKSLPDNPIGANTYNHKTFKLHLDVATNSIVNIGSLHNTILNNMFEENFSFKTSSQQDVVQEVFRQFTLVTDEPVPSEINSSLLISNFKKNTLEDKSLRQAIAPFRERIGTLPQEEFLAYTKEYLRLTRFSKISTQKQEQISAFASVGYYSSTFWTIKD